MGNKSLIVPAVGSEKSGEFHKPMNPHFLDRIATVGLFILLGMVGYMALLAFLK